MPEFEGWEETAAPLRVHGGHQPHQTFIAPPPMIERAVEGVRDVFSADAAWAKKLAPFGYVGKGALYIVVGLMALDAALNPGEGLEGASEAIMAVRSKPFGIMGAGLLLIGLASYVLWQASRAVFDPENRGDGWKGLIFRGVALIVAGIYGLLVWQSAGLVIGGPFGNDEAAGGARAVTRLLGDPTGRIAVIAVGVAVMGYALRQLYRAVNGANFTEDQHPWLTRGGYLVRGFLSGMIGWFIFHGAREYSPGEIRGLQGVLETLQRQPLGNPMIFAVGTGLLAYGVLQLFRAHSWWKFGSG